MAVLSVAGVTFEDRQERLGRLYDDWWTEGRAAEVELELVAEAGNRHDENAVRIVVNAPAEAAGAIGYVPRAEATRVREAMRRGVVGRVLLEDMSYGSSGVVAAKVRLLRA